MSNYEFYYFRDRKDALWVAEDDKNGGLSLGIKISGSCDKDDEVKYSRLIAAAPELLEALQDMLGLFEPDNPLGECMNARAAIAKALGEAQ